MIFFFKMKAFEGSASRVARPLVSDTAATFVRRVGAHPRGQEMLIQGFWYTVHGKPQKLFDLSDAEQSWKALQSDLNAGSVVEGEWWRPQHDAESLS